MKYGEAVLTFVPICYDQSWPSSGEQSYTSWKKKKPLQTGCYTFPM